MQIPAARSCDSF